MWACCLRRFGKEGGGVAPSRHSACSALWQSILHLFLFIKASMLSLRATAAPLAPFRAWAPARCRAAASARPGRLQIVQQPPRRLQRCRSLLGGGGDAALSVPPAEEAETAAAVATKAADDSAQLRSELEDLKRR